MQKLFRAFDMAKITSNINGKPDQKFFFISRRVRSERKVLGSRGKKIINDFFTSRAYYL
jgi:hypothetical protein